MFPNFATNPLRIAFQNFAVKTTKHYCKLNVINHEQIVYKKVMTNSYTQIKTCESDTLTLFPYKMMPKETNQELYSTFFIRHDLFP